MEGRLQKSNELQQHKCNLTMKRLTQARLATTFVIKRWNKSLSHLPWRTILASLSLVKVKLLIMHLSMHCRISSSQKTQFPNSPLNQPSKKNSNQCQITGKRVKMSQETQFPNSPLNQPSIKTSNQCQTTGKRVKVSQETQFPNSPLNRPSKKTSNQCPITGKRVKMRSLKRRGRLSFTVTSQSLVLMK